MAGHVPYEDSWRHQSEPHALVLNLLGVCVRVCERERKEERLG
jgi:hypothetical protein